MKPAIFSAAFLALFAAAATGAQARTLDMPPADTIVVRLPNKAVMTLVVRDARQLRELPQYHLDSLVARLGTYIKRADEAAKVAQTDRITMEFFPDKDTPGKNLPEQIRITTRKSQTPSSARTNRVEVLLNRIPGVNVDFEPANGGNVSVGGKTSRADRQAHRDSLRLARIENKSFSSDFVFDLGLNTLVNKSSSAPASQRPELRTLGSRYVNLGINYKQRVGGKRSPLYLVVGPEFAFNNYMLEGNNKWINQNGLTAVVLETNGRQYQKTKLATSTFTVPLMFELKLRDEHYRRTITLGAGGFVGYRLASWTKLKYYEEGTTYKDKDYGSFNLNDWQYGLQGVLGFKSLTFFAKYNLNNLFRENQGPQAQTLSFGLRLSGK